MFTQPSVGHGIELVAREEKDRSDYQNQIKLAAGRQRSSARSLARHDMIMMHGRRTAPAMALACLVCLLVADHLLAQGAQPSRKLLSTAKEESNHGGLGSHGNGAGTATTTPEPCSGVRGSGNRGTEAERCDTAKWVEIHTDYIYTQDVKHP